MRERPEYFAGVVVTDSATCASTREGTLAAQLFGTVSRDQHAADGASAVQGRRARARGSGRAGSSTSTTSSCAARTAPRRLAVDAHGTRDEQRQAVGDRAQAGPAAAAHARPRPAEGGRARARAGDPATPRTRPAPARSWRWTRATARSWRWARRRRFDASCFAKPFSQQTYDVPDVGRDGRAAGQPRDRVRLSDRLDVQAGDRAGGARGGPDHADAHDRRHRALGVRRRATTRTPSEASFGADRRRRRAEGLLGHLLLQARRAGRRPGPR